MDKTKFNLIVGLKHLASFVIVCIFLVFAFSSKEAFDPIGGAQIWKNDDLLSGCVYYEQPISSTATVKYEVVDASTFDPAPGINVKIKVVHYTTVEHPTFLATCIVQIADFEVINRTSDANGFINFTTSSYSRTGNHDHLKLFISTAEDETFFGSRHNDIYFLSEPGTALEYLRISKKQSL